MESRSLCVFAIALCALVMSQGITATEDANSTLPHQKTLLCASPTNRTAVKKLISIYESTKNERILEAVERILAEQEKQQTIREQNNHSTTTKQWYCATGLIGGGLVIGGWAVLKIIGLFEHKKS